MMPLAEQKGGRFFIFGNALGQTTSYVYDGANNLIQFTDPKGQITHIIRDALNRVNRTEYADGRTTDLTYDLAGNINRVSDSISGETLYTYDSINRLISETTDRGIVSYTYDAISRITERRINGQDPTTYVYDRINRIRVITYRNKSVTYSYDVAGRLIQKLLPNGVTQQYNYDDANQLLSITYTKTDGTVIDVVSYTYDENSNRITRNRQAAGSVTETPFTATYDVNNRMLTYNGQPLTYDDNGNLISRQTGNGVVTYTWDARNQLISINGPNGTASFKYDAQGRRIEKTINGQTVSFLYDGPQAIAELSGSAIGATYHTGLQIDEVLARYGNTGDRTLLADALGSIIGLADDTGQTQTTYAYSPFGEVRTTGEASDNSLQYTGRENDNTGLDYYRARYYDPQLKRFISEDPIGLRGGINFFAYVGNSPINRKDSLGLWYVDIGVNIPVGGPFGGISFDVQVGPGGTMLVPGVYIGGPTWGGSVMVVTGDPTAGFQQSISGGYWLGGSITSYGPHGPYSVGGGVSTPGFAVEIFQYGIPIGDKKSPKDKPCKK